MDFRNWFLTEQIVDVCFSLIKEAEEVMPELVARIQQGDSRAEEELFRKLLPYAQNLAAKVTGKRRTHDVVEDITMSAIARFLKRLREGKVRTDSDKQIKGDLRRAVISYARDAHQGIEQKWGGQRPLKISPETRNPRTSPTLSLKGKDVVVPSRLEAEPEQEGGEEGPSGSMPWDLAGGVRGKRGRTGSSIMAPGYQASGRITGASSTRMPGEEAEEKEHRQIIQSYLDEFADEHDRQILKMTLPHPLGMGLSNVEVADQLGTNRKTAGTWKFTAMQRMKDWIKQRYATATESALVEWITYISLR